MIDEGKVLDDLLAVLRAEWQWVGDGDAPDEKPDDGRPWAWVQPASSPTDGPRMGGGEPSLTVRFRVTSAAIDGDGPDAKAARRQALSLDSLLRARILEGDPLAGTGWRCGGRWRDGRFPEAQPGGWTVASDYRLMVVPA